MPAKQIDVAKLAKVTPLEVATVLWKIMGEDLTKAQDLLTDLYVRGYKVVKLEDGE